MLKKTLLAGLAMALAFNNGHAWANHDQDDDLAEVKGQITAINETRLPNTITIRTNGGKSIQLTVNASTDIEIGDEDATLADLELQDRVEAKYNARTRVAVEIDVEDEDEEEAEARGIFLGFNGESTTEVAIDVQGDQNLILEVTNDTEIKLGNLKLDASELDLLTGLPVKVEYVPATGELLEIKAETSLAETIVGDVIEIDADARVLTLSTREGEVDIVVPQDLRVFRSGRPVSFSTIAEGDRVRVIALLNQDGTQGTALRVDLVSNLVKANGRIVAVNGDTITVAVQGHQLTLAVDSNTRITLNNRTVTLADIAAALNQGRKVQVQVTYRDLILGTDLAVNVKANANKSGKSKGRGK